MNRRAFLLNIGQALLMRSDALAMREPGDDKFITLFLCGDVMTGRGIDQVLPHPGSRAAKQSARFSDDRVRAFRIGATYDRLDRWYGSNVLDLDLAQGVDVLDASDEDSVDVSRPGAPAEFTKVDLYAARLQSLAPSWSVLGAVTGQYAFNNVLSPEEFSYGGEPFGRGYDPSELVGDSGAALQTELRYQGPRFTDWVRDYQAYAFYDAGQVWRRDPAAGEKRDESAMSTGLGLRFNLPYGVASFVEYAQPLTREVAAEGDEDARFFMTISATY